MQGESDPTGVGAQFLFPLFSFLGPIARYVEYAETLRMPHVQAVSIDGPLPGGRFGKRPQPLDRDAPFVGRREASAMRLVVAPRQPGQERPYRVRRLFLAEEPATEQRDEIP